MNPYPQQTWNPAQPPQPKGMSGTKIALIVVWTVVGAGLLIVLGYAVLIFLALSFGTFG